jgi:hypothetical protein
MIQRPLYLLTILLCLPLLLPATVRAQRRELGREVERENVRLTGTLRAMRPGVMQVVTEDGETWLVKIEANEEAVAYNGRALPDWLRPGMWIRFRTNLSQRLQADAPVSELTVFTPREGLQLGVVPELALGQGLFSEPKPEEKPDKDKLTPCMVAGRVAGIKKNKLMVAAGNASVTVDVTDDVRITVEVADLRLAQLGDKVEINGWRYPALPGRAVANRVTISGEQPLTTVRVKPKNTNKDAESLEDPGVAQDAWRAQRHTKTQPPAR